MERGSFRVSCKLARAAAFLVFPWGIMLHADKKNLESDFRVRMLHIREKELMFFVRNCQNMANLAALIACMAQSGLIFTKYIDFNLCGQGLVNLRSKELLCAEFTYPIAVFITMGLCLLCMWVSMLVSLLAPGLALRGPDGSMHECVRMIGEEYEYALAILACALLMFFVSAILWSWASQLLPVAIMLTIILVASVRIIWSMTRYTVNSFSIAKDDIVTGQMTSARSLAGRMRAHGYARLHEEREEPNAPNAHPDATRGSAARPPPPPPKPAAVWWGLRLVEQVRASSPPPPPSTHPHARAHTHAQTRTNTHTHATHPWQLDEQLEMQPVASLHAPRAAPSPDRVPRASHEHLLMVPSSEAAGASSEAAGATLLGVWVPASAR